MNPVFMIFWLIVAISSLIIGVYIFLTEGFRECYVFLIMSALAFALFLVRRHLKRKESEE